MKMKPSGAGEGADVGPADVEVVRRTVMRLPDRLPDEQTHGFSVVLRREAESQINDRMRGLQNAVKTRTVWSTVNRW